MASRAGENEKRWENNRLRAATEAFHKRCRSVSGYGDNVMDAANKSNKALLCLREDNALRSFSKRLVESKPFEYFILITIAANCVVLLLDTPLPKGDISEMNQQLEKSEYVFVAIYLFEAIAKIIAFGLVFSPKAYLRSGWNILDFAVVLVGLVGMTSSYGQAEAKKNSESFKALRAVRVLRPLKIVSGIPSLQVVMKSIVRATIPILQILFLVLFVIVIYAIIGLELLRDHFHYACFKTGTNIMESKYDPIRPCDPDESGRTCDDGYTCKIAPSNVWPGPNKGITTFDNIFLSMLTIFQCITLEGWTDVMYWSFDARDYNDKIIVFLIYISLIIIGSFFMLNLVLGVLSGEFAKERERVENRRSFFKLRRQQQDDRAFENYSDWIAKTEDIELEEERRQNRETGRLAEAMKKRQSLSDSIMHLIEDAELVNILRNKRKQAQQADRSGFLRTTKEKVFRLRVRKFVRSQGFYWAVIVCVFLNTVILSTEHYNQPIWLGNVQEISEIVFLAIFIAEMILKMYGLGIRVYFKSSFNCFDCAVVCGGILEMIFKTFSGLDLGISVLRSLRLLRIFKVTRFWSSLRNLVMSLLNSVRSILSLIFLLLLFIFIFALLGMQIFGGKFGDLPDAPRTNFDNFPQAMLAVFQIMTGEDWNSMMYEGVEAIGGVYSLWGLFASLYFVALVILGNYTLLNVFLAIAVDNLANAQQLTRDEEEEERQRRKRQQKQEKRTGGWRKAKNNPVLIALKGFSTKQTDNPFHNIQRPAIPMDLPSSRSGTPAAAKRVRISNVVQSLGQLKAASQRAAAENGSVPKDLSDQNGNATIYEEDEREENEENEISDPSESVTPDPTPRTLASSLRNTGRLLNRRAVHRNTPIIKKSSMFIFGPENFIRKYCHQLVSLRYFDPTILFIIVISSILLVLETPLESYCESTLNEVIRYSDFVCTSIFAFEVVVKMIDQGVILHRGSYLQSGWNVLDLVVVGCNIAALALTSNDCDEVAGASNSGQKLVKSFRVLRVFRPLKAINKSKKLKTVFQCMLYSVKNVINILLISFFFLFIFAVIGVQLFQGKFSHCNDESKMNEQSCQGKYFKYHSVAGKYSFEDGTLPFKITEREWKLWPFHFNNVFSAMLILFSSATGEGWPQNMYRTVDATEVDVGPIRDNAIQMSLFYVFFVVVFSFFFLNIFVALIIVTFQERGEKYIPDCDLDRNQRDCIQFAATAKPRQRFMPEDNTTFYYKVWVIVDSKPFELFIMTLIAANAIVLTMAYWGMSDDYSNVLTRLNEIFTFLFLFEAILKLIAFRLNYFRDGWNVFDLVIVLLTLIGTVLNWVDLEGQEAGFAIDPSFFRLFRAARLVKLLRQGYTIRILLWTFFQSFKALPYVVILIAMLFVIYAVIGMQLFGTIQLNEKTQINYHNNFKTFFSSILVLLRSATGENWHLIMLACWGEAPCSDLAGLSPGETCGDTGSAIVYFCTFYFLCSFLMLNLFVAVIMDNFEYLTRDESILGPHHLDEFIRVWSEYDPGATGRIKHTEVYHLMCDMSPPVGFGKKCPKFIAYKRLIRMNMPVMGDNTVLFTSTLFALIRTSLGIYMSGDPSTADMDLRRVIKIIWPKTSQRALDKMIPRESVLSSQQMTIGKIYCAKLIYENYKQAKKKRLELLERQKNASKKQRRPSLFRRFVGALRTGRPVSEEDDDELRPPAEYFNMRRRSRTLNTPPTFIKNRHKNSSGSRRTKHRSLKFFRSRLMRGDNVTDSDYEDSLGSSKTVSFSKDIPMDLTDINPTIISTDTEDDEPSEGQNRLKPPQLIFDNILSMTLEDDRKRTEKKRRESQSQAATTTSPPFLQLDVPTCSTHVQNHKFEQFTLRLDPFPDVIKSAENSPKHSLESIGKMESFDSENGETYQMILTRLNEHIARAVAQGQSPYSIYGMHDNDEDSWC